jgi:hypothetical protein
VVNDPPPEPAPGHLLWPYLFSDMSRPLIRCPEFDRLTSTTNFVCGPSVRPRARFRPGLRVAPNVHATIASTEAA